MNVNPLEDRSDSVLAALYRNATPAAKLAAVAAINESLIGLRDAYLAATQPTWSPEERRAELRRWWFSARD
jgi:hypothetical protein